MAGHSANVSAYSSGGQESDLGWQGCHRTLGAACMPWLPAPSSASQAGTVASSKPSLRALLPLPTSFSDPDPLSGLPLTRTCDDAGPLGNPGSSSHLQILNHTCEVPSVTNLHFLGIRVWASLRGHYSSCRTGSVFTRSRWWYRLPVSYRTEGRGGRPSGLRSHASPHTTCSGPDKGG